MIQYLSVSQVIQIHDRILDCHVANPSGLASACEKPRTSFYGQEQYVTLAEKAGALLYGLARNHPFADGNKRTAWAATQIFLTINGSGIYTVDALQGADFVAEVIEQKHEVEFIAQWLAYRFK